MSVHSLLGSRKRAISVRKVSIFVSLRPLQAHSTEDFGLFICSKVLLLNDFPDLTRENN